MTSIYRRNDPELAAEQFEDGVVIINFLTGRYFSLNSTAEVVWEFLKDDYSFEQIVAGLASHCHLPPSETASLDADVAEFLEKLTRERLVCVDTVSTTVSPVVSLPAVQIPYEPPKVEVFDDLAELILLDPIHDVNEQLGWPVARTEADRG